MNLKYFEHTFVYYGFDDNVIKYAKFKHLRYFYENEKCLPVKQAYKLNYKSVYPSVLERQKVNIADNIFYQSTVACLKTKPEFRDTGEFCGVIRTWWVIVNTCNTVRDIKKTNEFAKPVTSTDDNKIHFFKKFIDWLDGWQSIKNNNDCLTRDTFNPIRHRTFVFTDIVKYCFSTSQNLQYILAGKFTTKNLEKRFGLYRSLAGCNYNVSYDDIVGSEKKLEQSTFLRN